jgi:PAS domain S-box-containing protein
MRILVVDDHELVRRGICSVIAADPALTLCGEASDGQEAVEKATVLRPDLVVMDINMPHLTGLDATREIKRLLPDIKIVITSQHEFSEVMHEAFRTGALGYVVKSAIASDLQLAIAKVQRGEMFVSGNAPTNSNQNPDPPEVLQRSAACEKALRESEERFRSAMHNMAEGLYILDTQGLVTYVNPSAETMFGWTSDELHGKKMHDVTHYKHPDGTAFPASECPGLQVLEKGIELRGHEDFFIRKDGGFFPVIFSASPMKIAGRIIGIVVSFRDDTKRREAEKALRRNESIYRAIAESIDYGVWIADANGRNIYASPSFLELVGLTPEQSMEFGWTHALHPDDVQDTLGAWQECVRSGARWERHQRFRRPGGGWQHILARGVPIRDDHGEILYWAGINLDIQNQKETELALEERIVERTEELLKTRNELRELSLRLLRAQDEERRRIARELHDGVGQLLAAMNMNLSALLSKTSKLGADATKAVEDNRNLVDQALRDIRTISYLLHPPLLDEIGLASALQWYLGGFAERSKIAASLEIAPDLGKLHRDLELSLFRIVQECLTNIHRHSGSLTARVRLYRTHGEIVLEVIDEGIGIPRDVYTKISTGKSFGLGLRGIRERLRQFGGRLELKSNETGTVVLAVLPDDFKEAFDDDIVISSTKLTSTPSRSPEEAAGSMVSKPSDSNHEAATILCIDDEPSGMYARKLLLESAGHRVVEARSGPEGIRAFKSEKIDAVVLDYWMSGMKGTEVAAELKGLDPSVPIIVLSGLPDFPGETTGVIDEWLLKGNNRAEHLLDTLKALLERRPV